MNFFCLEILKASKSVICIINTDENMESNALYNITYGLYVVGCYREGKAMGCIINTCFQVTSENPKLAICLNKNNYTLECIKKNPRFCLSIIAEDTDPMIISSFGFRSGRDADKYADFGYEDLDGAPAVNGSFCGRLILDAIDFIDCGTHEIVIGWLVASHGGTGTPMTYAYYHNVIKGNAPKNAPTYPAAAAPQAASAPTAASAPSGKKMRRFKCDICGYEVETEGDLPADFVCPVCGFDRSHFKEI